MLDNTRPEELTSDKHSNLLGSFVTYQKIKHCEIWPQGPCSQHFIFFETYEWTQLARVFQYTRLERLSEVKCSGLFGPFISYKENEVL